MDSVLLKRLAWRFLRGMLGGAVGTMATLVAVLPGSWNELSAWLSALLLAGLVGAISGGVQAAELYWRNLPTE